MFFLKDRYTLNRLTSGDYKVSLRYLCTYSWQDLPYAKLCLTSLNNFQDIFGTEKEKVVNSSTNDNDTRKL